MGECTSERVGIPFLLPSTPPTGKKVEIPVIAIVSFGGDRLFCAHTHWDQSTLLASLDLLPPHVPCPSSSTSSLTKEGKGDPIRLPVSKGTEAVRQLGNGQAVRSNLIMKETWAERK